MRKLILFLFLTVSVTSFAQPRFKGKAAMDTTAKLISSDTIAMQLQHQRDSIAEEIQQAKERNEQSVRNGQMVLELQRENTARKKRSAFLNIAIGVGFAVLLVFGLLRRRKKPENT
jgi:predicted ABC-type ATPase